MSHYGSAESNPGWPRAHAICDRCGKRTNHYKLNWQMDWRGPRMQNLRILVCDSCYDTPQQNGQRTIIYPPDPVPIMNARPEQYVPDNNPLSGIGGDPLQSRWQYGFFFGSMTEGGGPQAAFDGNPSKPSFMAAVTSHSNSSFANYVGVNWTGQVPTISPSSISAPVLTHTLTNWTIRAPVDSRFGSTSYLIQGSQTGSSATGGWTTLSSGATAGTIGEEITGASASGAMYQFHRVAFSDNGGGAIAVAYVAFSVAEISSNTGSV